jgi:hypothetical protein
VGLAVFFTAPPMPGTLRSLGLRPHCHPAHSLPSRRGLVGSRGTEEEAAVGLAVFFTVCCIWGDVGRHLSPP